MQEQTSEIANEVKSSDQQPTEKYWAFWWGFPAFALFPWSANINFPFFHNSVQCLDLTSPSMQQVISIWVRDPRIQKNDFWHAYIDYEICLQVSKRKERRFFITPIDNCDVLCQTTSVCFTKKISCVRRRYSEFAWLRQKLKANSMQM